MDMEPLTRRDLLADTLLGAAGAGALTVVPPTAMALGANERIGVGVIGVRGMGHHHLRNLLNRADVQVVSLCDVDKSVLDRAAQTVKDANKPAPGLEGDFRRVMDDRAVEAIVVATPH